MEPCTFSVYMSQSVLNTESENFKLQYSAVGDKPDKP